MPRKNDYSGGKKSSNYSTNKRRQEAEDSRVRSSDLEKFYQKAHSKEAEMNMVRAYSFMEGLPFIGGLFRGYQQARYLDDYYKNTGLVPKYPGVTMPGYSGFGSSLGNLALTALSRGGSSGGYNVKEGTNDLLTFYNYAYV